MVNADPATYSRPARYESRIARLSVVLLMAASIEARSLFCGGVRTSPINAGRRLAQSVPNCQSIHLSASARRARSSGAACPSRAWRRGTARWRWTPRARNRHRRSSAPDRWGSTEVTGLPVAAENTAEIDALIGNIQLSATPQHLLDVYGVASTPDPELTRRHAPRSSSHRLVRQPRYQARGESEDDHPQRQDGHVGERARARCAQRISGAIPCTTYRFGLQAV